MSISNHIWIALDFETSSQNRYACRIDRVCVMEFDIKRTEIVNERDFNLRAPFYDEALLKNLMASSYPKVAHNAKYELYLMEKRLGIPIEGELHDTYLMVKHWKNNIPAADLKSLSWWLTGDLYEPLQKLRAWIHEEGLKGEDPDDPQMPFDMTQCPDRLVHEYCIHDCLCTARLAAILYPQVKDSEAYRIDTQAIRLVSELEANGMPVDIQELKRFMRLGKRRIRRNMGQARDLLDVEPKKSPTGHAIRNHLAVRGERRKTPSGLTAASEPIMRDHRDSAAVCSVLRVRRDQKTVGTYARNMLAACGSGGEDWGSFHPNLLQSGAITLRFRAAGFHGDDGTVAKGQVQNFPRGHGIRDVVAAPPGYWFSKMDLASIEARLFSSFMEMLMDEGYFAEMYRKSDEFNVYVLVLKECAGERRATKSHAMYTPYKHGVLGKLYGSSAKRFSAQLRDDFELDYSVEECQHIFSQIDRHFPFIRKFQRSMVELVRRHGGVLDPYGMFYHVPQNEAYKVINYLCQGCAGWVLKDWWCRVERCRHKHDKIINTVHDELDVLFSDFAGKRAAQRRLAQYLKTARDIDVFTVPIIAESSGLVHTWGEAG